MILMPWISIVVVFKCVKLWYRWCVINKITYIFCICLIFFCHFGVVYVLYRWVFLNEKWAILSAMPCDRLNYHPLPCDRLNYHPLRCDRLNWHTLLNQWEDRKFTWNIIIRIMTYTFKKRKHVLPWLISISPLVVNIQPWLISISPLMVNVQPWMISISSRVVDVQPWLISILVQLVDV